MSEVLSVKIRETRGKRNSRRLRRDGHVPAILYGHGKDNVCLSLPGRDLSTAIRHGARVVDLRGALDESAYIREIQWDTFGVEILHADLTRVKAGETIETNISVETRGEAPGVKQGGVVQVTVHEVIIDCPVTAIPEKLEVNVNELELEDVVTAGDLEIPDGAKMVTPADTVVVQCVMAAVIPGEEDEEGAGPLEPEVIGRKPGDEEESDS